MTVSVTLQLAKLSDLNGENTHKLNIKDDYVTTRNGFDEAY